MEYIYIIFAIYFINLFFGLKLLFTKNYNLSNIIYLLLLVIIFPFLTPFIYIGLFFDESIRKSLVKKRRLDQDTISGINDDSIFEYNDVTIYTNGKNLFEAIFTEIEKAEKYIHISFYTFNTDQIGKKMIEKLTEKLNDHVEVIILYDRLGSFLLKKKYFKNFKKQGGKLIAFMPFFKHLFFNLNYRNHRKTIVIDNKVSFIGGFNVSDKYLSRNKKMGLWVDSHLKIIGDATKQIEKRFLADYAYSIKSNIETNNYLIKQLFQGNKKIEILSSGADVSDINYIESKFIEYIYKAKEYIYIQTPYLILNDSMIRALKYVSTKGIKIKIMIPNKNDHPFVLKATKSYARTLISKNIMVYLFDKNAFLHSKVFISDDNYLSIGTTNFDIRSFKYDLEINTFIYNQELALHTKEIFLKQLNYCTILKREKQTTINYIKELFCKLLSTIL